MNKTQLRQLSPKDHLSFPLKYGLSEKFKLAEAYPNEIKVVTNAYSNPRNLSQALHKEVTLFITETTVANNKLVSDIILFVKAEVCLGMIEYGFRKK